MAKSKQFRVRGYDADNNPLIFDTVAFCATIVKKAKAENVSQAEIIRQISRLLYPDSNPYDKTPAIKNWMYGKNSPSSTEEITMMEKYFDLPLLRPISRNTSIEERNLITMTNHDSTKTDVLIEYPQISLTEAAAAKEAYSIIMELIRVHQELMHRYVHAGNPILGANKDCIPPNYPAYADIYYRLRMLRFDLPCEVCTKAIYLTRDIYGPINADLENYRNEATLDMSYETDEFNRYMHECGHDSTDESSRFFAWFDFANNQASEYCDLLDEIFCDYLK